MANKDRTESKDRKPKLALRKETLRQLTDSELRRVAGASNGACAGKGQVGPPSI